MLIQLIYLFLEFSNQFSNIFKLNSFENYFKVFLKDQFRVMVIAVDSLQEKCISISLDDNSFMITPVLDFEHD